MTSTAHITVPPFTMPVTRKPANDIAPCLPVPPFTLADATPPTPSRAVTAVESPPIQAARSTELSEHEIENVKADIAAVLEACPEANDNERLVNLISICLESGINTSGWIISIAGPFGFKRGHVGSMLTNSAFGKSKTPLWASDEQKRYSLLP